MARRPYHYGFKTRDKAEDALESDFAFGLVSECNKPQIEAYTVTRAGKPERRFMITIEE